MDFTPIDIDEFGTTRFSFLTDAGTVYDFEKEDGSTMLFITIRDWEGRALSKKLIDTTKNVNKTIVKMYEDYVKEKTSGN